MPDPRDDYEPTEADIDMIAEEVSGKPVDLAAGITSMRLRIAQLEAEKTKRLDRMAEDSDKSLREHLA